MAGAPCAQASGLGQNELCTGRLGSARLAHSHPAPTHPARRGRGGNRGKGGKGGKAAAAANVIDLDDDGLAECALSPGPLPPPTPLSSHALSPRRAPPLRPIPLPPRENMAAKLASIQRLGAHDRLPEVRRSEAKAAAPKQPEARRPTRPPASRRHLLSQPASPRASQLGPLPSAPVPTFRRPDLSPHPAPPPRHPCATPCPTSQVVDLLDSDEDQPAVDTRSDHAVAMALDEEENGRRRSERLAAAAPSLPRYDLAQLAAGLRGAHVPLLPAQPREPHHKKAQSSPKANTTFPHTERTAPRCGAPGRRRPLPRREGPRGRGGEGH